MKSLLTLAIVLLFAASASAADVKFSWLQHESPTVTGYKIHYGDASRNYTQVFDVTNPVVEDGRVVAKVTGLEQDHTYFFVVSAYSATQESDYSNEVEYTTPLFPPSGFKVDGVELKFTLSQ